MEEMMHDEAEQAYTTALKSDASHPAARAGLAQVAFLQGRLSEAAVRAEQLIAEKPDYAPGYLLLARILVTEGEMPRARSLYDKALAMSPSLSDPGLEKALQNIKPGGDETGGRKRAGVTSTGSFLEASDDEEDDDNDGHPLGGAAFDLGLADFEKPKLNFSHVGGMDALKEEIRMKIIYPLQHAELFKAYDKKVGGGVLLYGPPGVGKTLISKATAGEIQANFIALGLHQILDMWIGNSEKHMHEVFELARKNAPCVLFFDEVDALAADRRDLRQSAGRNLINQFLSEMDGAALQRLMRPRCFSTSS
jgi:transitional endoplasmic reticulum ATPase